MFLKNRRVGVGLLLYAIVCSCSLAAADHNDRFRGNGCNIRVEHFWHNPPYVPWTWEQIGTTLGIVGGITGLAAGAIALYNHYHWTDERIVEWSRKATATIEARYNFLTGLEKLDQTKPTFIEIVSNFGMQTNSGLDDVLKAAGPLHSAVKRMHRDLKELCLVITECGNRHLIEHSYLDHATRYARLLSRTVRAIIGLKEYKMEMIELEKIMNSRESLALQNASLITQLMHQHEHVWL
ncbi:MAG: hypothetical protein M1549_00190 [Candidatus Dependentiae bacterium]|nr:hypothetical protein [Candidatus Dependentiae bacterium]